MKTVQSVVDSRCYKKDIAINIFDHGDINTGIQLSERALIFLDTNILLWLYRINNDARIEIIDLLNSIKDQQRLCIPSWVVHEYNYHITKRDDVTFFPFKKPAKEIVARMNTIEKFSKLIIDDEYLSGSKYKTKKEFLKSLENTASEFRAILKSLVNSRNKNLDTIQSQIECLLDGCILRNDLNDLLRESASLGDIRFKNNIPPGFCDESKAENKFGDYILWLEIIRECKAKKRSALIISNDVKADWVYTPRKVFGLDGIITPNCGTKDIVINVPHPYLDHEFKSNVDVESELMILNIEMLSHLATSTEFNPMSYFGFKNLAEAVSVESNIDDTYLVISWFLQNHEEYMSALKGVAHWQTSPDEIDVESLGNFIKEKVPDIDITKVSIGSVIGELFI